MTRVAERPKDHTVWNSQDIALVISGERSTYCMFRAARPSELLIEVGLRFTELIDDDRVILYVTVAVEDSAYDEDSLSAKFEHCWSILYVSISHE